MHVGLIRHFPVKKPMPSGWMTAEQLHQWRLDYESSEPIPRQIDTGNFCWKRCLSSDLKRAVVTAQAAFPGEIIQTPLLREIEFLKFNTGNISLPIWIWQWVFRLAWMTSHQSQRPVRDDFQKRVRAVADMLEAEREEILVVSHAGMMGSLRKELIKRGFKGPHFQFPDHALLYVYER